MLRIIKHLGHFFFLFLALIFFDAIPFRPSDINMKHHYDKIISHLFSEANLSALIREKRCWNLMYSIALRADCSVEAFQGLSKQTEM